MDEKKKLIIVGVLAVVIVSVGAFEFLGSGSPPPAPAAATGSKTVKKTQEEIDAAKKKEQDDLVKKSTDGYEEKNAQVAGHLSVRNPFKPEYEINHRDPDPSTQKVDTESAGVPKTSQPIPTISGGDPGSEIGKHPGVKPIAVPEPKFTYHCVGAVVGNNPMAVFADGSGAQKMISEGGAIDGDSRVVKVSQNHVTVVFRGKKLTLTVGGN